MRYAVALVVLLVGCSAKEVPFIKLEPGSHAVVAEKDFAGKPKERILMFASDKSFEHVSLTDGVQVTVLEDPGYSVREDTGERFYPPHLLSEIRTVKVRVDNGQYEGRSGILTRSQLRASP